ncbi:hypothetical protein DL96DRAFT_1615153, partial [Flagelloscypha sp. PMI_526]
SLPSALALCEKLLACVSANLDRASDAVAADSRLSKTSLASTTNFQDRTSRRSFKVLHGPVGATSSTSRLSMFSTVTWWRFQAMPEKNTTPTDTWRLFWL